MLIYNRAVDISPPQNTSVAPCSTSFIPHQLGPAKWVTLRLSPGDAASPPASVFYGATGTVGLPAASTLAPEKSGREVEAPFRWYSLSHPHPLAHTREPTVRVGTRHRAPLTRLATAVLRGG
jgi:hypothetical protein